MCKCYAVGEIFNMKKSKIECVENTSIDVCGCDWCVFDNLKFVDYKYHPCQSYQREGGKRVYYKEIK